MQMLAGEAEDTAAADEGEAAHHYLAEILHGVEPESLIGTPTPQGYIMTRQQLKYVSVFVDFVRAIQLNYPDAELWIEHTVAISSVHPDCWGTFDCGIYIPSIRKVYILDLKYGYGLVDVYDNAQLQLYALGFLEELITHRQRPVDDIVIGIIQPRAYHSLGQVRTQSVTKPQLSAFLDEMRIAAAEAMGPNPTTLTGKHCKHCTAAAFCPALKNAADHAMDFIDRAEPQNLSPQDIALYLDAMEPRYGALKTRYEALKAQAEAYVQQGQIVPGWRMGLGRGSRIWNRSDSEMITLGKMLGVPLSKEVLLSPNQAEDAGVGKDVVEAYQTKIPGKPKLERGDASELAMRIFNQ
jgi:hypothetical protein